MEADEGQNRTGQNENVEGEKARKRVAVDDGPAEHELDQLRTKEWHPPGDGRTDAGAPIGILVETHDLTGEGQTKG